MKRKNIKIFDLTQQYQTISREIESKIAKIFKSGQYILGKNVLEFERRFSKMVGAKYAVSCNSGTDALILSLKTLNIKKGDEIITTPFTYFATAEAIVLSGAKPVFVDIDPLTFNINHKLLEKSISKKTRAILPVHIFGQSSAMHEIRKISKKYNLKLIEDCAQSTGSLIGKKMTGSFGDFGCFSFFPTKNLGAAGDAGIIVTSNKNFAEKLKKLRNHGGLNRNTHESIGLNSRMDEIQAAILLVKLKYIDSFNKKRNLIAEMYNKLIINKKIIIPYKVPNTYHVYHQYTLRVKNRKKFITYLQKNQIPFSIYYPDPLYRQKALKNFCSSRELKVVREITKECISIPIYPELDSKRIKYISRIINQY